MDSSKVHDSKFHQTSQGAHPQTIAYFCSSIRVHNFKNLTESHRKLMNCKYRRKRNKMSHVNIPRIPILPLERFQWALA